jgi:hypothetical protein
MAAFPSLRCGFSVPNGNQSNAYGSSLRMPLRWYRVVLSFVVLFLHEEQTEYV